MAFLILTIVNYYYIIVVWSDATKEMQMTRVLSFIGNMLTKGWLFYAFCFVMSSILVLLWMIFGSKSYIKVTTGLNEFVDAICGGVVVPIIRAVIGDHVANLVDGLGKSVFNPAALTVFFGTVTLAKLLEWYYEKKTGGVAPVAVNPATPANPVPPVNPPPVNPAPTVQTNTNGATSMSETIVKWVAVAFIALLVVNNIDRIASVFNGRTTESDLGNRLIPDDKVRTSQINPCSCKATCYGKIAFDFCSGNSTMNPLVNKGSPIPMDKPACQQVMAAADGLIKARCQKLQPFGQ